jgi:uncharacterized protein (DUF362 family)/NAD-dependent dihydropyrimidine dehydrogenase PreA subunit
MSKVAILRCESYDYTEVKDAVSRGIELIGGIDQFSVKDKKLLLKPNLLIGDPPEKCTTTHPSVFRAVAELFKREGAIVSFGDSPSFGSCSAAAKKAGLAEVAEELGIPEADFKNGDEIFFEKGIQNKKFVVAKAVRKNDIIISIPKLKTHALERMTGCVKNQFGCVPGVLKGEYHVKVPDAKDFARMLVDLNNYVNPSLYIMDGIMAMEGNGPRGGTPTAMNIILISTDPIALDATVCRLVDINPEYVPTTVFGMESGAGTWKEEEIELLGDDITTFINPEFDIKRKPVKAYKTTGIMRFFNNRLVPKPHINESNCIKCGVCVNMCPANPKAVDWFNGKEEVPSYNYSDCIRCYCCQELCPEGAITLKTPFLRKVINLFTGK